MVDAQLALPKTSVLLRPVYAVVEVIESGQVRFRNLGL